jgi:hypothetical protein
MGFVGSQHLDSVRDKIHLHDFSHIGEVVLEMGKQPSGALSKLLLKPADIPEFIEDLPNMPPLAKGKDMKLREQTNRTRLMKTSMECSGAKMMTRTITCYSPTSNLRVSRSSRLSS